MGTDDLGFIELDRLTLHEVTVDGDHNDGSLFESFNQGYEYGLLEDEADEADEILFVG